MNDIHWCDDTQIGLINVDTCTLYGIFWEVSVVGVVIKNTRLALALLYFYLFSISSTASLDTRSS